MKNVRENQLKKCIFLTEEQMNDILTEIYKVPVKVKFSVDGLWYDSKEDIDDETLMKDLRDYFEVKDVTSIHIDDCDIVGIWVCYKD